MRHDALAGLLLLLWPILPAAGPAATPVAYSESRAGKLLVATPDLTDPTFAQAVVLILQDDDSGSLGLIVNRPLGEVSAKKLLAGLGLGLDGPDRRILMYEGGPVQPETGFVIHDDSYRRPDTVQVAPGIEVTSDAAVLKDITLGKGPKRSLPLIGYAGWGPGQLESEITRGQWTVIDADPALVFDTPSDQIWQKAWHRRGIEL
jgi:putative transcriptional regulator